MSVRATPENCAGCATHGYRLGSAPTLHTKIDSAGAADRQAARGAGAGRIP